MNEEAESSADLLSDCFKRASVHRYPLFVDYAIYVRSYLDCHALLFFISADVPGQEEQRFK